MAEFKSWINSPVPHRRRHPPVAIFEHITKSGGGGPAPSMPDVVGGDKDGAGRCSGTDRTTDTVVMAHHVLRREQKV